uniref:Hypotheticial protein n=1 Tax=Schistosoma japonicum TaxID=6182 RepID=C7TYX6_SCHJA|nr:hypotheticial protein [Schistosoma japonicum]
MRKGYHHINPLKAFVLCFNCTFWKTVIADHQRRVKNS